MGAIQCVRWCAAGSVCDGCSAVVRDGVLQAMFDKWNTEFEDMDTNQGDH